MKKGDVVGLKSGGPVMTVCDTKNTLVRCQWFNDKDELKVEDFPIESLKLINMENQ